MTELAKWRELFKHYGFDISTSSIEVRPRQEKQNLYVLSPQEVTNEHLVTLYAQLAKKFTDCGFFCIRPSIQSA